MSAQPPGTVVFDCGAVLCQWQPLALMREFLPQWAHDEASARAVMDTLFADAARGTDWASFDRGEVEPDALSAHLAARTGYPRAAITALIESIPSRLERLPDTWALLPRLRARGHRLGVLSNMPRPFADHLEATHPDFAAFDVKVWSGRVGHKKPEPALFEWARTALSLDLDRMVFIDDHAAICEAAQAQGWHTIRFDDAAQCERELRERGWL
jgi:putative hydrolase of the HAD superfamily